MIAILEKSEHNVDFRQIVDFIEASNIRYALTINIIVYVSHIRQFWSTARIKTTYEGTKILATVNGKPRTFFESSIRRNLKLNDKEGNSTLPDAKIFENLTLMGYNILPNQKFTFQKGQFSHQWKFLIHTIMVYNVSKMIFDGMVRNVNNKGSKFLMYPSLSFSGRTVPLFDSMLVTQGEGSAIPTEPHHTPFPQVSQSPHHNLSSSLHPTATTKIIPTTTLTEIPTLRQYFRRAIRIAQSKALHTAADEPTSLLRDDSQGEAFPIQRQQTKMASKITAQDLEISTLKARIKLLEDKDKGSAELSEDDAPIKGRSMEIKDEAGVEKNTERGSNDTEELVNVLTSIDATNILTSGVADVSVPPVTEVSTIGVPTVSGLVPTVSAIFTTTSMVTPHSRRPREISAKAKGKEKMVEFDTPNKKKLQEQIDVQLAREIEEEIARDNQRMNEQIARDAEIARIHVEKELKMMIDGLDRNNEVITRHLQEYKESEADLTIGEKIELINELVKYQDHHAKILKYQAQQSKQLSKKEQREFYMSVLKSHAGWKTKHFKEEGERVKRKGLKLEQGSAKKIKTSEDVSEEDLKEMMQLVHVEEVYVEALKVKHPIIDWEIHSDLDRKDLNQLWALVKETLSIRPDLSDKEKELWVELKRLFEPDFKDQLWTRTQNLMHDLLEWRLYDTCGVHYVLTKDQEIFMLVEMDYPLGRELAIVLISNKLQEENYSQMANDLILKIHNIANSPR
nr:hypothetical protein [Tanacetum cinerariifolium]